MNRCFQLAQLGTGNVAPNPIVGSVLVYDGRIIGEGFHTKYGGPHAEVNCIDSVKEKDKHLISRSTIYVSLEPCAHHGKTPPCCDLIIENKIPKVVVACRDSFEKVNGEGIKKLIAAGIEVTENILHTEALELNKRFFTFHNLIRPYIILKWAQSSNSQIAAADLSPVKISNVFTDKMVHKWRSEEAAILVGTNTALHDDPALTDRLWKAKQQPVRMVIDEQLKLSQSLKLFDNSTPTIVVNRKKESESEKTFFALIEENENAIEAVLRIAYNKQLNSLIVEGGAKLLQSFINAEMWDEARIITNEKLVIENGLDAPELTNGQLVSTTQILSDSIRMFKNKSGKK